MKKKNKLYHS